MNTDTETLISVLRDIMQKMTDCERICLIHDLMDGYCINCGSEDNQCHCDRDE